MKFRNLIGILVITTIMASCSSRKIEVTVSNSLGIDRNNEVVELTRESLGVSSLENISIVEKGAKKGLVTQLVDENGDGKEDVILFQPTILANSSKTFEVIENSEFVSSKTICYSRFVPERTDDYTWENNRVAFRVYGPTAQKMIEENIPGGTLSSGVDLWLKRVEYPVIDKWYKETTEKTGSYHIDTGEGLDNFHVGVSRGVGGIAVKSDGHYFFSKNYTTWRTITTGPLRTSFELTYASWDANGKQITESKIITLDKGNFFSKFDTNLSGTETISVGITLGKKNGSITGNEREGWLNYWQPHGDDELGSTLIAPKKYFVDDQVYLTPEKDLSNAYLNLKVLNNKVVYYSGYAWTKAKYFENEQQWNNYLEDFSQIINNPMKVSITK